MTPRNVKFPCRKCEKPVAKNHRAVQCDVCDYWVHIKCNNITALKYESMQEDDNKWVCTLCLNENLPFSDIEADDFDLTLKHGLNQDIGEFDQIQVNLNKHEKELLDEFSEIILQNQYIEGEVHPSFCQYYDIERFTKNKFKSNSFFSVLHLNIHSLQAHITDLVCMLKLLQFNFKIIAITETKLYRYRTYYQYRNTQLFN